MLLPAQNIHLWQASLLQSQSCLAWLVQTLSPDEHARAQRFHFERDRRRFMIGRGVLRDILARYLDRDARQITFAYTERGKPYLPAESSMPDIFFNLAHSNELAIYAIASKQDVGVDLEYIHPVPELDQIAAHFFSAAEYQAIRSLSEDQKQLGFFNCWTRKEAYLKALGDGLSKPLDQFEVSLAPADPARLLHVMGDDQEAQRWSLLALGFDQNDYVGSLAIRNSAVSSNNIEMFSWPS
jgi:4'-phosphopantetheinyl transferase